MSYKKKMGKKKLNRGQAKIKTNIPIPSYAIPIDITPRNISMPDAVSYEPFMTQYLQVNGHIRGIDSLLS